MSPFAYTSSVVPPDTKDRGSPAGRGVDAATTGAGWGTAADGARAGAGVGCGSAGGAALAFDVVALSAMPLGRALPYFVVSLPATALRWFDLKSRANRTEGSS